MHPKTRRLLPRNSPMKQSPKRPTGSCIYLLEIPVGLFQTPFRYVGQAGNFATRVRQHKYSLRRGTHHNSDIQGAFNQYKQVRFRILDDCPKWQLNAKEAYWRRRISNVEQCAPKFTIWSWVPALNMSLVLRLAVLWGLVMIGYQLILR
jgi:hypothetical protein